MQIKFRFAMCFVLLSFSHALFALGLGGAEVRSFLNQPLHARLELISQSQEELNTVVAGLASAADFEIIGLSRTISVPLRFDVNAELANAFITVTSRLPISDPVVQLVVEVTWTGGRMLREYNLFLDPPTFASRAPAPAVISRPAVRPATEQEPISAPEIPAPETLRVVQGQREEALPKVDISAADASLVPAEPDAVVPKDPEPVLQTEIVPEVQPAATPDEALPGTARQTVTVPDDPVMPAPAVTPAVQQVLKDLPDEEAPPDPIPAEISAQQTTIDPAVLAQPETDASQTETDAAQPETDSAQPETRIEAQAETGAMAEPQTEPKPPFEELAAEMDSTDGIFGPVQRGDTLWGIAFDYTRQKEYSINQAMLAIQRLNPEAFSHNNINSLKQGAILRMPARGEINRLSKRQAMFEAIRQESAYHAMRAGLPYDDSLPVFADAGIESPVSHDEERLAALDADTGEGRGLLELVPPSESGDAGEGGSGSGSQPTGALSTQEVHEVLARTEEELANSQQENTYLNERIRELEAKIAQIQDTATVADRELADMEDRLREERLSGETEQPIAVIPPREDKPWYEGRTGWIAVVVLLILALVVWFLMRSSRGGGHAPGAGNNAVSGRDGGTVSSIRGVIEAIPESMESGREKPAKARQFGAPAEDEEEATELDSSDPETKLDLARAYISMSDHDAAREMLEEVLDSGNDEQVREAQEMMGEL